MTTEALSIGMAIKSKHDLNQAAAARRDTTIITVTDPTTGKPVIDPVTGLPKTIGQPKNQNLADRLKARRTHLEDWIAATVFNHLFSGADAWVAHGLLPVASVTPSTISSPHRRRTNLRAK